MGEWKIVVDADIRVTDDERDLLLSAALRERDQAIDRIHTHLDRWRVKLEDLRDQNRRLQDIIAEYKDANLSWMYSLREMQYRHNNLLEVMKDIAEHDPADGDAGALLQSWAKKAVEEDEKG